MAFADYDAYLAALSAAQTANFQGTAIGANNVTRLTDLSRSIVPAPANPTTSAAYSKASDRAINGLLSNAGAGRLSVLGGSLNQSSTSGVAFLLVDILNMSGGMSGTVTGTQTTGLPTAALTRYTSGVGVQAAVIGHAGIGTTATTFTATYTNQAGTGSQVTPAVNIGAAYRDAGFLRILPLADGDTGIRSVESINIVANTGIAGNIGIVMFKPLALFMANDVEGANVIDCVSTGRMVGQLNEVLNDACLSLFAFMPSVQAASGTIILSEA